MSNTTKQALEAALKEMMLKKPLDKITIRDLTETCGISRMAFYYHFKDIYDLVEWACAEDAAAALQGKRPATPGRRAWHRSLRRFWKINPLSSTPTAASAMTRWSAFSIS